jgi:hypothetical protein
LITLGLGASGPGEGEKIMSWAAKVLAVFGCVAGAATMLFGPLLPGLLMLVAGVSLAWVADKVEV